ncbi:MAG TPA: PAS domain S-box protein [Microvirga sp.]|jgi:two-component system sensor kinase FixL|nr:PAS domain S-box protein [Microvirga sp.]
MTAERVLSGGQPSVSDARLASVLDTAVDGIVVIDENARILIFNKACESLFGYEAGEVVGREVGMLMPAEDAARHHAYLSAYRRTGERKVIGRERQVFGRRKDGTLIPLELVVGEVEACGSRQFTGFIRDMSARQESERRMNELQADLVRLARVSALDEMGLALAHELNQPLTAILLYLQAASLEAEREKPGSRASAILDKARREAQRAGAIIGRMRQLGENRAPERRPSDLNALVEEALELTQMGDDSAIRVLRDYTDELPLVEVDQVQIQQVVINLVRNALEALRDRPDGEVVVSTRPDGRGVLLCVADNGPGIPPDRVGDLFQAFRTGKPNGMGLGLAISRTIVQSHGGELQVDPGGAGRGARFLVRLPGGDTSLVEERGRA